MSEIIPAEYLNTAPCGFLVFSDEGTIMTVNDTLLDMLQYERESLIGHSIERILTLANRIFYQTHLFPLITLHGKAEEIFITLLSSDKREIHVLLNAKRKTQDDIITNHCILIPVQQRRKYEHELLHAKKAAEEALLKNEILLKTQAILEENKQEMDRQVSRLTQMHRELTQVNKVISHDIQEPIRKIAIFADIAMKEAEKQANVVFRNSLEKISHACLRMAKLVSSLEHYMALQSTTNNTENVDLNLTVEKGKSLAIQSSGYKDEIVFETVPLPVMQGSRSQIELLFFNLFENAIKFRQPSQQLKIRLTATIFQENSYKSLQESYHYSDVVKISFTDNGKGFDTEHSNNLFQLFQKLQVDSMGTGLGLALCKKIVDNHFGEISFDSSPGKGCSFHIILPLKH
jgi:sigma-B regulation protein RsbU (phosphoserine phosphatase)